MKKALIILALISVFALTLLGCSLEIFDWNQRAEIISDYLSWSGLKGDIEEYEVRYKHFGTYGDSVAIYFHTAGAYETPVEEEIAGCKFSYPDSRVIRIWNNGKFYKMQEAFEKELISEADVEDIHSKMDSLKFKEPLFIFEEKVYFDFTKLYRPYQQVNRIIVTVDSNLSREGKTFDKEFFEIENIEFSEIEDLGFDEHCQKFKLYLSEPSAENLIKAITLLEAKEGLREVYAPHGVSVGNTPNDTYYTTTDGNEKHWGLDNIEAEKIWDSTT